MVGSILNRLGLAGAILIASVFVFGVLAGAVVVNRLQTAPTADVQEQGDKAEPAEPAEPAEKEGEDRGPSKPKHPDQGRGHKTEWPEKAPDND